VRSRLAWIRLALPAAAIALVLAGAEPGVGRSQTACNWGASSIAGTFANGTFVVTSGPTTTGCIPR